MGMDFQSQNSVEATFSSPDYELIEKIGEGGFGHVYKALQHSTQKLVAIKFLILSPDFDQEKKRRYIERFHRESDLIRRLNHPNIVHLIDKGQQSDLLIYAVYEYIDGYTLKEHLDTHGALNAVDTAEIMACVLDALSHAHEKGVIHRDIKPANIMLYQVGAKTHVKVLDFGIGTLKNEVRQLDYKSITLTQETLGTPTYSSPEQLRGEPPVAQTDIYVWGLVFLECLTGVPTITGRSLAAIFHQQLSPTNVPLGILAGHNSAPFFRRVLNKKSYERPANTAELYHEFEKINFVNLTGTPSPKAVHHPAVGVSDITQVNQHDETLVNDGNFSYSRLTERKQISVLSVILTTACLQSEEQTVQLVEQDVIDTFHSDQMQQCIDLAVRYGATHVGSLGDTLLFYFGYPKVSDNDSRLCSRAALEIVSNFNRKNALLKKSHGIVSHIQMGMQAGLMQSLAGNIPEGKAAHDAMSLCRQAKPGQIVCSESVKLILESYLNFERLINPEPVNASASYVEERPYLLRSERLSEAFGFLRSTQKNRAFVGRELEIKALVELLAGKSSDDTALQRTNRIAHIQGEAGIGKSRLVFELRERIGDWRHFVAQCLPEHQNNALYPILTLLKVKYALSPLSDEQKIIRLAQAIELSDLPQLHQEQGLSVLSSWLNITTDEQTAESNAIGNLSPALQKQRLFDVLSHLLCQIHLSDGEKANDKKQHLFIFEDLHWADPTSKEFIHYFVQTEAFKEGNHCWLNTSREDIPTIMEDLPFLVVKVDKLSDANVNDYVAYLFNQQPLSKRLSALLIERTDGIPLFIEELASTLQKQKLVHKVNGTVDFVDSEKQSQVPVSLRESLQQRLDWLEFAKDTAQLAATIGRTFDYDLLVAASSKDEAQVQIDLDELIKAELIYQQRQVEGDSYIFKHALVRDAAYEGINSATLKHSHLQVANSLEVHFPDVARKEPMAVAQHFASAEVFNKAVCFGIEGAKLNLNAASSKETALQTEKIKIWLRYLHEDEQRKFNLALNEILITLNMLTGGWASEKVKEYSESSIELLNSEEGTEKKELIKHLWWKLMQGLSAGERQDLPQVVRELEQLITVASDSDKSAILSLIGYYFYTGGDCQSGRKYIESAVKYDAEVDVDPDHLQIYGWHSPTFSLATLGRICWEMDDTELALTYIDKALIKSRELNHVGTLGITLMYASIVHQYNNDKDACFNTSNELLRLSQQHELPIFAAYGRLIFSWASNDDRHADQALVELKECGSRHAVAYFSSLIADIYLLKGEASKAVERFNDCISLCQSINEHYYEAQLYHRRAMSLWQNFPEQAKAAEDDAKQAMYLAKQVGATYVYAKVQQDVKHFF
ncbi:TOMM system kinase/cyclase fusion protein [Photobacterium satsumensis]|uniref:TOMM system kinase/cyclase fusion protein n=1 Tax=Photobacterium satsumensis TaxID=2910239 RepID=UPI003D0ABE86